MSLIKCSNCGHDVSDKAYKCPRCGFQIRKGIYFNDTRRTDFIDTNGYREEENYKSRIIGLGVIVAIILIAAIAFVTHINSLNNCTSSADTTIMKDVHETDLIIDENINFHGEVHGVEEYDEQEPCQYTDHIYVSFSIPNRVRIHIESQESCDFIGVCEKEDDCLLLKVEGYGDHYTLKVKMEDDHLLLLSNKNSFYGKWCLSELNSLARIYSDKYSVENYNPTEE